MTLVMSFFLNVSPTWLLQEKMMLVMASQPELCRKVSCLRIDQRLLTRWVPYDGYIRHQNDHLSGRMTDISVMGEWQVAGVGGTRPLRNVLGEALEGRFSFEARKYLFSIKSYVRFEEFFLFPALLKNLAPNVQALGLWFRWCLGRLFENSAPSPGLFLRTPTTTTIIFWEFPFIFPKQSRCYLQADSYGDPQAEQSTLVMVRWKLAWNLTSGRWRDRAQKDHRSSSRLVRVVCGDPWSKREKKTQGSQRVIVRRLNPSSSTNQRVLRSLFPRPDVATVFALRCFRRGRGCTAAGRSGCGAGKAKKSSHPWHFRCWSLRRNELECTDLAHWTGA